MDFTLERIFCYYCRTYLTSRSGMQKHLPKCRRKHKGKKKMLVCTVDSLHHVPVQKFEEHVRKCKEAHGLKVNPEFLALEDGEVSKEAEEWEINSVRTVTEMDQETIDVVDHVPEPKFEENVKIFKKTHEKDDINQESWEFEDNEVNQEAEEWEVNSRRTISKVDQENINAFSSTLHRTYQCIWGLSKKQKKEWDKAEYQRIQNLMEGLSIDDIEYPKANGTYVTIGEIKAKYLNGSDESLIKPAQACSIAVSKEDYFEEYPIIGCDFKSQVTPQKSERKIENAETKWSSDSKINEPIYSCNAPDTSNGLPNEHAAGDWIKVKSKIFKKQITSITEASKVKYSKYFESGFAAKPTDKWKRKKAECLKSNRNVNSPNFASPIKDLTSITSSARNKRTQESKNQSIDEDSSSNTFTNEASNDNIAHFGWGKVDRQTNRHATAISPCEEDSIVPEKLNENVNTLNFAASVKGTPDPLPGARKEVTKITKKTIDEKVSKYASINETSKEILSTRDSKSSSSINRRKRTRRKPKKPEVELADALNIEETSNIQLILNQNASSADHPINIGKDSIPKQFGSRNRNAKKIT